MKNNKANWQKIVPIIFSALSATISLLTAFFIAKPLGAEEYGKVQFYVGIMQILSVITAIGLPDFITKNVQFAENKKSFFSKYFFLVCCWSIIIYPAFFSISYFLLTTFEHNIIIIFITGFASFFQCVVMMVGGFFLGNYKQTKAILFDTLIPKLFLFFLALILIFAFSIKAKFSIYYIYGFLFIYGILSIIFIFILVRKTKFRFSKKEIITILSFFALSATYSLNTALGKVIGSEYYDSFSGVGAYSLSAQIVTLATLFTGVITSMSKPVFSSLAKDKEKLISYFQKITRINSYIVIPFCMGFIVQAKSLLSLFGDSYTPFYLILILMSSGTLFASVTGPNGSMLAMANHEKIEVINGILNIAFFLIGAYSFIFLESTGLALATFIAVFAVNLLKLIEIWVVYRINPYPLKLIIHLLILMAVCGLSFYFIDFIQNIYIKLAIDCVVGLLLIILGFVVNPNKNDKYFFSKKNEEVQ